jgi:hypothetical protein
VVRWDAQTHDANANAETTYYYKASDADGYDVFLAQDDASAETLLAQNCALYHKTCKSWARDVLQRLLAEHRQARALGRDPVCAFHERLAWELLTDHLWWSPGPMPSTHRACRGAFC